MSLKKVTLQIYSPDTTPPHPTPPQPNTPQTPPPPNNVES